MSDMVSLRIGRNHSPLSAGIAVVQLLSSLESNLSLNRCHRSPTVSTKRHRSPTLSSLVVRFYSTTQMSNYALTSLDSDDSNDVIQVIVEL